MNSAGSENGMKRQRRYAVAACAPFAIVNKQLQLNVSSHMCLRILTVTVFEKTRLSCTVPPAAIESRPIINSNRLLLFDFWRVNGGLNYLTTTPSNHPFREQRGGPPWAGIPSSRSLRAARALSDAAPDEVAREVGATIGTDAGGRCATPADPSRGRGRGRIDCGKICDDQHGNILGAENS